MVTAKGLRTDSLRWCLACYSLPRYERERPRARVARAAGEAWEDRSVSTDQPPANDNPGWAIISYLIAGMLLYGGIGWLIGRWTGHSAIFLPAGMLIGLGLALALVIFRYGRS